MFVVALSRFLRSLSMWASMKPTWNRLVHSTHLRIERVRVKPNSPVTGSAGAVR